MSLYHEARFWKGVGWLGSWNDFRLGGWVGVESFIRRRLYAHNWDTRFLHLGRVFCLFFSSSLVSWPAGRRWDYGFFFPLYLHLDGYARSSDVPEYTMATFVETENIYPSSSYTFIILLLCNVQPGL